MACCGGRRKRVIYSEMLSSKNAIPFDGESVMLQYVGADESMHTYYGSSTGAQYRASASDAVIMVDKKDAITMRASKPGLLEMKVNGNPIFELVNGSET